MKEHEVRAHLGSFGLGRLAVQPIRLRPLRVPRLLSLPRVLSPEVPVGWRAKSRGFGCCDIKSAPRAGCVPSEIVQTESSRLEGGGRQVSSDGSV